MKLPASIHLIRQLAGGEGIADEFNDVEAEHLRKGLLKLTDTNHSLSSSFCGARSGLEPTATPPA
jgi:hypothetical protein